MEATATAIAPSATVKPAASCLFSRLAEAYRAWRSRQAAIRELTQLTDHELADIGLSRSQIPDAVYGRLHQ